MSEYGELAALMAGLGVVFVFVIILVAIILIPVLIAQWKLFKKAGKNGWEAIVPFYNTWVLMEISGLNWWYFLISIGLSILSTYTDGGLSVILSLANYYINFITYYNLAKKTKQNEILYGILGIFVPYIAIMILGFSKNITYDKSIEVSPNGVF